jgi:multimeric flavodoxin WrbA/putative sterol carrier protein
MKINIYYGGRGLIEDSTLFVLEKIGSVLDELNVSWAKYNLYERKGDMPILSGTIKEADAVIFAVNIEWLGIGGNMQQFLDACWLYADRGKIKKMYMMPVVISNTDGEKEGLVTLWKAWEILGGLVVDGICAYVSDHALFETDPEYVNIIENKAVEMVKAVNRNIRRLPSSSNVVNETIVNVNPIDLTPDESEQLSIYVSDESYVKKQKVDIEELTALFKDKLQNADIDPKSEFIKTIREHFRPTGDSFEASLSVLFTDTGRNLMIEVNGRSIKCYYGTNDKANVFATLEKEVFNRILNGRATFQGSFMSGGIKIKGDFKTLRVFDQIFQF